MIGSFGEITFEIPLAPDSGVSHRRSATYGEHEVIGGPPLLQKTGRDSDELEMSVRIRRFWGADTVIDVTGELELLRANVKDGTVGRLMLGDEVLGQYVLTSVDTTYQRLTGERIDAVDVNLTFQEYH